MKTSQTIMIVEDEIALNDAYTTILEKSGYQVLRAYDGDEALLALENVKPTVILLDLRMPNVGGIEFLRRYPLAHDPSVHIIVFSNLDTQTEIQQAYELGAERYMLKAWASPKDLVRLIEETLHSAHDLPKLTGLSDSSKAQG